MGVNDPEFTDSNSSKELLQDRSKYFHGIGFDLPRIGKILKLGILTEKEALAQGANVVRNTQGFNLNDTVSVAESPSINNTHAHGAFGLYIKSGISFVIDRQNLHMFGIPSSITSDDLNVARPSSRICGEQYIAGSVPTDNIVGVMVPEEMLNKKVTELSLGLKNIGWGQINDKCTKMVAELEKECGYTADISELYELIKRREAIRQQKFGLERDKQEEQVILDMEKYVTGFMEKAYAKKMGKEDVTLRDILEHYLPSTMKVYDTSGSPIQLNK
jgi:hypothetical protein